LCFPKQLHNVGVTTLKCGPVENGERRHSQNWLEHVERGSG
jgi:hypothetical protein